MAQILSTATDYIFENKLENRTLDRYNWLSSTMSKEYVIKKYKAFLNYGRTAWVEPFPKDYYFKQHSHGENSNILHMRWKGVIEIDPKLKVTCHCRLAKIFTWEHMDAVANKIKENPSLVYTYTCKR